jgi:hypothetical protein
LSQRNPKHFVELHVVQYPNTFYKKRDVKTFGPGAFVDPMLDRAVKISCSNGMAHKAMFSLVEIEPSNKFRKTSVIG